MSEETVRKVLKNSGLTEKEADVYIFLAKHDAVKGTEIAKRLGKDKSQIFHILKKLQAKGFAESTIESPTHFTAAPFENVLNSIIGARREEAALIEKNKEELLDYLRKAPQTESESSLEKFVVVKGDKRIYARISKMILETKHELLAATTVPSLMRADQFGIFDVAFNLPLRRQIHYRFLTELSNQNLNIMKSILKNSPKTDFNLKARNPDWGFNIFPRMIARDNEEILFFITPRMGRTEKDDMCLWTNSKSLVQAFTAVFEDLWTNSTDVQEKIAEIETGRQSKTYILSNADEAKNLYEETIRSAKEEIMLLTSSEGLTTYSKNLPLFKKLAEKGISIKIMAPIVSENLEAVEQLAKVCSVRHVQIDYLETTIVDGKRFFQFNMPPQAQEEFWTTRHFENAYYTDDFERVEKMKNMLNAQWENASTPSTETLEAILGRFNEPLISPPLERPFPGGTHMRKIRDWNVRDQQQSKITEKDVLDKILNGEDYLAEMPSNAVARGYGSDAGAVIHPPSHFNLPDILINITHYDKTKIINEKQSQLFEDENALWISLLLTTPKGNAYVPVAVVVDNPVNLWKEAMAGTPAGQNVQLVTKDKLQVQTHRNSLFVGWAMPIPLCPPTYVLPPACLLIEASGNVKTEVHTTITPSGCRIETEGNSFNAFVTLFHPSAKYSGPSTDGFFGREHTATIYPPSLENRRTKQS